MKNFLIKNLFYCPVKSLSFNESSVLKIVKESGIHNDRIFAFTRGLDKKSSVDFNNSKIRNLNYFLTLKNTPDLKNYNFIFEEKKNILILYLKNKKLIETNINDKKEIFYLEKYIEINITKIKKPIFFILNKNFPFFDTTPGISISLINLNSIKDLENKMNANIEYERFRGNILIDYLPAWEEFNLIGKTIKIGEVKFNVDSRIPRCSATNVNPNNSKLDMNLPNSLIKFYNHKDMGIYLSPLNSGKISTKDFIKVL